MINLSYVAAYDPYHAKFRFLALLDLARPATSVEAGRIADFFLCFPYRLTSYRPDPRVAGQVKAINALRKRYVASTYDSKVDVVTLFNRMRPAQLAALNSLAAQGYLVGATFRSNVLERTSKTIATDPLKGQIEEYQERHSALLSLLRTMLQTRLLGPDGLKARSGLEEFRYDNV